MRTVGQRTMRKINSDWRSWLALWFGKDWIFFLWMGFFGRVDENMMMKCVKDICKIRAAGRQDEDKDPASTRVDVVKLSERNMAIELGLTPLLSDHCRQRRVLPALLPA